MATEPWPHFIVISFACANQPQFATDQSAYHGPYPRLFYYLFGLEGPFEVFGQFSDPETTLDEKDEVSVFRVLFNKQPVFFINVKPPASFLLESRRKQADDQMRDHFRDLRSRLVTPRLLAISAFGTRLCFYEYTAATSTLVPAAIPADPVTLNDTAPADRWSYDVLDMDGIARVRQVVEDVKSMCQALDD